MRDQNTNWLKYELLGPLEKFRKVIISLITSVCLCVRQSVRMVRLDSTWTDFHEIWHFSKIC